MGKITWALLIASTLATGGMVSVGPQAFAQETADSSVVAPQTQEQLGQENSIITSIAGSHTSDGSNGKNSTKFR